MCELRVAISPPWTDEIDPSGGVPVLRVLAVGDLAPSALPAGESVDVVLARFDEIAGDRLAAWRPALVLAPLVGAGFDGFDLAEVLIAAGFTGRFRAVVHTLPNPAVVRREFAAQFPGLDFDVLVLSDQG